MTEGQSAIYPIETNFPRWILPQTERSSVLPHQEAERVPSSPLKTDLQKFVPSL